MNKVSATRQILGLSVWLLVTFVAAAAGTVATLNARGFYQVLARPSWAPPGWLFGPVWSLLYCSMAFSAWLVWREHGFRKARVALSLFIVQLAVNGFWSWLFFAWHRGAWASAEIMILWVLLLGTVLCFWRMQKVAACLLLPYLVWVTFAVVLCFATWRLNPDLL